MLSELQLLKFAFLLVLDSNVETSTPSAYRYLSNQCGGLLSDGDSIEVFSGASSIYVEISICECAYCISATNVEKVCRLGITTSNYLQLHRAYMFIKLYALNRPRPTSLFLLIVVSYETQPNARSKGISTRRFEKESIHEDTSLCVVSRGCIGDCPHHLASRSLAVMCFLRT